jgi:hypothetical protein
MRYSPDCVGGEFSEVRECGSVSLDLFVGLHVPVRRGLEVGRTLSVLVSGHCLFQLLLSEDRSPEVRFREFRFREVRFIEVRLREVRSREVRSKEVRPGKQCSSNAKYTLCR